MAHRGPDNQGVWVEGPAALGHRRLAILDLSENANQPMHSPDGRYVIVFNGEIYNYRQLRAELKRAGEHLSTTSDTEVVLAGFARHGARFFAALNGMFAVAIWDRKEERLTLARDRFGQKPLFVWHSDEQLVFASEIKGILRSERVRVEVDWAAAHEFFYFSSPLGQRTLFAGIRRVEAGHFMTIDARDAKATPFWSIEDIPPSTDTFDDAVRKVRSLLDSAVQRHLVSDVPVGVLLSGGIDSSAVTLLATRHSPGKMASFSVAFDFDPGELPRARAIATEAGTEHHELHVHGTELTEVVKALVYHHDMPFGDSANIPLYLLAEQLGGSPKVVLGGDGGDEIFAGYRRYNVLAHTATWRALGSGVGLTRLLPDHRFRRRLDRFLRAAGESDSARRMALLLTQESPLQDPTRVFSRDVRVAMSRSDPFERYERFDTRLRRLPPVQRMLHTDCSILLPDLFCEKVDRATMAQSLEVRLPFLDADLTDYVLGLPWRYKVRHLKKKWLLRQALRGVVPDAVLDGPKRGFGVPSKAWLRGPLRPLLEDSVLRGRCARDGVIDTKACRTAIDEHVSGIQNHSVLYKLLQFAIWYERYV